MDDPRPELHCNKKQAIEVVTGRQIPGPANTNTSLCGNDINFDTAGDQFFEYLLGSENDGAFGIVNRNSFEDQFGNDSSMCLSTLQTTEDLLPCLSYGGIEKLGEKRVGDTDISTGSAYDNACDHISLGPTYTSGDMKAISEEPTFLEPDSKYVSNHPHKGKSNCMLMSHNYSEGDGNFIQTGQVLKRVDEEYRSLVNPYEKGNCYIVKDETCNGSSEIFNAINRSYSMNHENIESLHTADNKAYTCFKSMAQNCKDGSSSTISFGSTHNQLEMNPSFGIGSGYQILTSQPSALSSIDHGQKFFFDHKSAQDSNFNSVTTSNIDSKDKSKETKITKKVTPNTFPLNVKALLSTGMLDGVPVKYVCWSRETNLKGIISGCGYLCGCSDCNFSKVVNAYEFERHAGIKTKHPNNHIYCENGKTIYAVVQELKSTPQEMLFEAIQNVTGSLINQKNFHIWKTSYQAAERELQRIYKTDEVTTTSS